jgi:ABC-type Fe3+/spermidine/putrescine transport system ATPase subunit
MSKELRTARASELLELVSLAGFEERNPTSLSGGEQQRVALARTLAPGPSLVLFDEPLGAIDQTLKDDLLAELMSIVKEVGTTSVYVTHDRTEAETFAERMAILRSGRVVASGSPLAIWQRPETPFVAAFIGHRNVVDGQPLGLHHGPVAIPPAALSANTDGLVGRVVARTFRDGAYEITVEVEGQRLVMADTTDANEGSRMAVAIDKSEVLRLSLDEV